METAVFVALLGAALVIIVVAGWHSRTHYAKEDADVEALSRIRRPVPLSTVTRHLQNSWS